jgi:hypothetical protein
MANGKILGMTIYIGTILVIAAYFWLIFFMDSELIVRIFVFSTLAAILSLGGWIGYDLVITSPKHVSPQRIPKMTIYNVPREESEERLPVDIHRTTPPDFLATPVLIWKKRAKTPIRNREIEI